MARFLPPQWKDGDPPRSREDLLALLRQAMSKRVSYLDPSELHALADSVLTALKRYRVRLSLRQPWTPPLPPKSRYGTIAEWRWATVEIQCLKCSRNGTYDLAELKAQLGDDVGLTGLAVAIAGAVGCTKVKNTGPYDRCEAFLPQVRRAVDDFNVRKQFNHRQ